MSPGPTKKSLKGPPENLLLVEGDDDLNTIKHLLIRFGMAPTQESYATRVRITGGYPSVLDILNYGLKESGLMRIGVVVDSDTDIKARWQALRDTVHKVDGFANTLPRTPDPAGTVVDVPNRLRVGIWMMPDNATSGAIEDFAHKLLPATDRLWPHVETSVAGLPVRLFTDAHTMKAKMNTWLAWQEKPGNPIGLAIFDRYLDANAAHAQAFKSWLTRLFEL